MKRPRKRKEKNKASPRNLPKIIDVPAKSSSDNSSPEKCDLERRRKALAATSMCYSSTS